jgi:nucleotide-binding universal stress UspA family protein
MTFKRILFATDFSPLANEASLAAAEMSKTFRAPLLALHVVHFPGIVLPDGAIFAGPEVVSDIMTKVESALHTTKDELAAAGAVEVTTRSEQGVPFVEIVRVAREGKFDLIVIGTHGRTGIRHVLIGSTSERVVRKAPCAVMVVRHQDHTFEHP